MIGPLWVDALIRLRLFPSRQTAERRLRLLEERGRLRYAGRLSMDGHKRTHLWCNRLIGQRMLRHETDLMRAFFAFWPHAYALTGSDVDPRWRADMELTIGQPGSGRTYMVEIDEDTEPLSQVTRRLAGYVDCPRTVLLVAPTVARAGEILRLAANERIYVSWLERCLVDPWGVHWRNCRGEAGSIARPGA